MNKVLEFLKKNKKSLTILFLIILFGYYLIWVVKQPFNSCPDEGMKWDICKYIYENNKIPHGDDEAIRNDMWGISYAFQPILTYMICAVFMKIMSIFSTNEFCLLIAARLVSTISMVFAVYFTIKISDKLFKKPYKYLLIAFVVFQPLISFIASYINNDSTAFLMITIIIYLWILGLENNWKTKTCIELGIAIGICSLTYYNAYGYILCSVIICVTSAILNKMKTKDILKKGAIVACISFCVAGWWFIRNAIIYNGDFLGINAQNECGNKYALDEYKPDIRKTPLREGKTIIDMLIKDQWISITVKSFIGVFGYNSIVMSPKIYYCYLAIWTIGIVGCIIGFKKIFIYNKEEKNKYLLRYVFLLAIIITCGMSIFYSYTSDFQPQGRYIAGIMIPFTYFIINGIKTILEKFIKSQKVIDIIVVLIILLLIVISFKATFNYMPLVQ